MLDHVVVHKCDQSFRTEATFKIDKMLHLVDLLLDWVKLRIFLETLHKAR